MNYTYIVECKDGTLYTGWTNNLEKRIADHNSGKGAKYTRARKPVTLVYYDTPSTKLRSRCHANERKATCCAWVMAQVKKSRQPLVNLLQ